MNLDLKGTFLLRNRTLPADVEFVFVPLGSWFTEIPRTPQSKSHSRGMKLQFQSIGHEYPWASMTWYVLYVCCDMLWGFTYTVTPLVQWLGHMSSPFGSTFPGWLIWHLGVSVVSSADVVAQGLWLASTFRWFQCPGACGQASSREWVSIFLLLFQYRIYDLHWFAIFWYDLWQLIRLWTCKKSTTQ